MRTNDEVKHAFQPVGNLNPTVTMKMMKIQRAFEDCAGEVLDLVPEGADRTYLLRQLLDCKFWAVQAITHEVVPSAKKPAPAPSAKATTEPQLSDAGDEKGQSNGSTSN